MAQRQVFTTLTALGCLAAAACTTRAAAPAGAGGLCEPVIVPALAVEVTDSISGASLAAQATGYVSSAGGRDSLVPYEHTSAGEVWQLFPAHSGGGRYWLHVEVPGYVPWGDSVIVAEEWCHPVETVHLRLRLQRRS